MEKIQQIQTQSVSKGNSEDSLLVIYILRILKKYSSPTHPLSSHDVMDHLREDYSIGRSDKEDAQRKKIRRHLDTLQEFYVGGCIRKKEGKRNSGHTWYYDITRDTFAKEEGVVQETLSDVEAELLVDLLSATKILNAEGTRGIIDKLLRTASVSDRDRVQRLAAIQKENWLKTLNSDLIEKKDLIEGCFDTCCLTFDYEDETSITAIPLGWRYDDGICMLSAKVGDTYREFSLDKIRNYDTDGDGYADAEDFRRYDEETDSDKTTLDSLLVNIPVIKRAIADRKRLRFLYQSYTIANDQLVFTPAEKSVLPHSLVFNDGKYFLIGIDENAKVPNKIAYFRVDFMFELCDAESDMKLSDWDKYVFETIERAREVEKHPLMLAGKEMPITLKVTESALDRVIEAFAAKPDRFLVTNETRTVKDAFGEGVHEERVMSVQVRTTKEEAFRWALANADVVELVAPQEIRDRIARLAEPIYQLYTQSLSDKVRENIDYVLRNGTFKITSTVDADTAYKTYQELSKRGELGIVDNIGIVGDSIDEVGEYIGDFTQAKRLCISSPQFKIGSWASRLVNVETLDLTQAQIDDPSWMKGMKRLKRVHLFQSSVTDLSVLSEHTDIYDLDISDTGVSDIHFIETYKTLQSLNIVGCPIEDYSPLLTMQSRLQCLEIDENALEIIGEENIRNRHIGIDIIPRKSSPFWYLFT